MGKSIVKVKAKKNFTNISSRTWEHPLDKAALGSLKKIPGFGVFLKKFIGHGSENSFRLMALSSSIRISANQFPKLYHLHNQACSILDIQSEPELYITKSPFFNAGAVGVERPFIILDSTLVESLSDEEILGVIGHELGHILSGHALYKSLLIFCMNLTQIFKWIPFSQLALMGVILALHEWNRKSELSSDRCGLLTVQDPEVIFSLLMKSAGGAEYSKMDLNDFFKQAEEYEAGGDIFNSLQKLSNLAFASHPFPVLRLTQLKSWVDSGEYQNIMDGNYLKRTEEEGSKPFSEFKEAKESYQKDIKESKDPLSNIASEIVDIFDSVSGKTEGIFNSTWKDLKDKADSFKKKYKENEEKDE